MSDDLGKQITSLWNGFRKKAVETVTQQEAQYVRGKVSAKTIADDRGQIIVDAGHRIDDAVIQRAQAAGKMHALLAAAVTAQAQDVREQVQKRYESTPDGQEAQSMATSDQYLEARNYIGRIAGVDITDIRGNVLVPAGKEIKDEDVRLVRDAGQLTALIYAAQQAAPLHPVTPEPVREPAPPPPSSTRAAVPFDSYYDETDPKNL